MAAENVSLGDHLVAVRRRRGMTQQGLAEASSVSVAVIRKLEQKQRLSTSLETLTRLAHALDVDAGELLGKPRGLPYGAQDSELLRLRRAVLGLMPVDGPVLSVAEVQDGVRQLWRRYWAGDYPLLARELPAQLMAANVAISAVPEQQRPVAHGALAQALQIAASLLAHLAHEDLAHLALHGARRAAEAAGDELLFASQQATRSWLLSRQGLWSEAEHLAVTAAAEVEPALSQASLDQVAVWGELLRYTAVALSRSGRHAEADEMIGLMRAAAARMGADSATRYVGVAFGPTVVAMRAVDAQISAEKPRRALELTRDVERPESVPPAMHMRYLLNVAWAQTLDWRSGDAVGTLLRAERIAPKALHHQGIARATVAELLPRRRKHRLPGLVGLANRMGLSAA
ncbi:helix-turn-helix domain-containing protein [Catenuloplanes atrovinosus]|uniref:Transcriptional regulator with XRE-family HTH domain n=1 Tax=Catenuloplanes atrovinosus TaxID=137266 RepID=A0AAE3YTQ2_9ACTN|nr:helix-turn-helix transcriptional regulator [Catenuloplanes atrovinosus]MDR7277716.1 transcriptional regulator with XRE-family HTH domain [Catenuloplanes atrovinosus]